MCLRTLAASTGLEIRACASLADLEDDRFAELLGNEFNRLALENDLIWETVHPNHETFAFERADELVNFADRYEMAVTGSPVLFRLLKKSTWMTQQ